MRAELVEEPQMRAFGDVVVVHRPEHGTEGIGIGQPPVAAGVAQVIAERLAFADVDLAFEEAGIVAARQRADFFAVEGKGRCRIGMRHEAAGDETVCRFLYAEHRERIAMHAGHDGLDVAGCCLEGSSFSRGGARLLHLPTTLPGLRSSLGASFMQSHHVATFQISFAYWRMVRSEENQPIRATLRIARAYQSGLLRQTLSTSRWVAA